MNLTTINRFKLNSSIFIYSIRIGLTSLFKGLLTTEVIKRIICPMDVSRYYEFSAVISKLTLNKKYNILDISSPKLVADYLTHFNRKISLYSIDYFKAEIDSWKKIIGKRKNLILEAQDARHLNYKSNFFDQVYSISVIEHLGNGKDKSDLEMLKEVYRVLKKGGKFYMTTIISNKKKIIYKKQKYYSAGNATKTNKNFFCKIYDHNQIKNLIGNSKFKLTYEEVCNYRFPLYERLFNLFIPYSAIVMGWLSLFLSPFIVNMSTKIRINNRAEYFCILEK